MDYDSNPALSPVPDRRSHPRVEVAGEVTLRRDGSNNYRVHIVDLSETGCRVEMVERPRVLEGVWVKFDGLEGIHAVVTWVEPPHAGLRFERPLHPAVFDQLAARLSVQRLR
jgi:hypothetical protein